jgi:hypothetical protein
MDMNTYINMNINNESAKAEDFTAIAKSSIVTFASTLGKSLSVIYR